MNPRPSFIELLRQRVVLGDGAIGTELLARGALPGSGVERLNLMAPDSVLALHRAYVAAGSELITTNTFAANRLVLDRYDDAHRTKDVLMAGARLARQAATDAVYVAGAIGPLPPVDGVPLPLPEQAALFLEQASTLLDGGVDVIQFETFINLTELVNAVRSVRTLGDFPVLAQMAFESGGIAPSGERPADVAGQCIAAGADLVGTNCGDGISTIAVAVDGLRTAGRPVSAYVNSGIAEWIEGRRVYGASRDYLVQRTAELLDRGVTLIGGCCGTNPEFIQTLGRIVAERNTRRTVSRAIIVSPGPAAAALPTPSPAVAKLAIPRGIIVEVDPPHGFNPNPVLNTAAALHRAGVTALTVADNPLASACMDNLIVAGLISRQIGCAVIPHLVGRDRNRIALQSYLMGAHATGIRSVLCITGDPVRMYNETNTKGVFDVTSVGLVKLVNEFNQGQRSGDGSKSAFAIGVALNPNVRTLSGQIDLLKRKVDAGAHFALTQPVFDEKRIVDLRAALDAAGLSIPIFIGILPLVSSRNAEFLHNEVPGISIPEEIRKRLVSFQDPADQRRAACDLAAAFVSRLAPHIRDFYFITPRNKVDLVLPLIRIVRACPAMNDGLKSRDRQ